MPGIYFQYNTEMERMYWKPGSQLHASLFSPVLAYLECIIHECPFFTFATEKIPTCPSFDHFMFRLSTLKKASHPHPQRDAQNWKASKNSGAWQSTTYAEKECYCIRCQNSSLRRKFYDHWITDCVKSNYVVRCQHYI